MPGVVSVMVARVVTAAVHDRPDYLISMLAQIGDTSSVELLRTYVDDPTLGPSAIQAIKQLTGENR